MSERTNKIYDWPLINLGHIFNYILKAKRFSEDYIRRYKDEKAYSYFEIVDLLMKSLLHIPDVAIKNLYLELP